MDGNYIKLSRGLLEWEWYTDINTTRLFIHMLLKANWKDGNFKGTTVPRGSFVSSIGKLSSETGLTEREIRTAISHLKTTGEVTSKTTNRFTVFTVVKYDLYQTNDKQNVSQEPVKRQPNDILTTTIEEKKEGKNKRINNTGRFEPPDVEMVRAYCQERGNKVDPQAFVDFYESKGWMVGKNKMKNWKAAVRTWEKEDQRRSQTRKEETAKRGSTGFNNFTGRDYDMDQMERALLGIQGGGNHAD